MGRHGAPSVTRHRGVARQPSQGSRTGSDPILVAEPLAQPPTRRAVSGVRGLLEPEKGDRQTRTLREFDLKQVARTAWRNSGSQTEGEI